jgi:hypothetical protein
VWLGGGAVEVRCGEGWGVGVRGRKGKGVMVLVFY